MLHSQFSHVAPLSHSHLWNNLSSSQQLATITRWDRVASWTEKNITSLQSWFILLYVCVALLSLVLHPSGCINGIRKWFFGRVAFGNPEPEIKCSAESSFGLQRKKEPGLK